MTTAISETGETPFADGKMLARRDGAIGYVTFNQPEKRNAMSLEMWQGLGEILSAYESDHGVRVVVMRGAGGKAFVSGADISQFDKHRSNDEARREYSRKSSAGREKLATFAKPIIAEIDGFCLGGGLAIAMQADLRIASDRSQFGIPAGRLGIAYTPDSVEALISLVGPAHARMILYSAERFGAAEAERIGLINRVVPEAELSEHVRKLALTIADNAPLSVAASRLTIAEMLKSSGDRDLAAIDRAVAACFNSDDYKEGRAAFKEKRRPKFAGR